ncbi:hypothetical protein DRE_05224 [Drechslerella stenobrocha 248]|uniref:Uncharacterized protein n=1 Tax=Drechslerella stenobrocha 248 TaxID=1043628 RepID=W7I0C8_9PEZI|nr:hypothetical protein DRE_05224 [Drechslerella stenobrocha 248]
MLLKQAPIILALLLSTTGQAIALPASSAGHGIVLHHVKRQATPPAPGPIGVDPASSAGAAATSPAGAAPTPTEATPTRPAGEPTTSPTEAPTINLAAPTMNPAAPTMNPAAPTMNPAEPPATNPAEPPATNPAEPPATNPAEPPATNPAEPPATNPAEPPATNPAEPPATNPAEPPATNPAEPPATNPAEPPATNSPETTATGSNEATQPGGQPAPSTPPVPEDGSPDNKEQAGPTKPPPNPPPNNDVASPPTDTRPDLDPTNPDENGSRPTIDPPANGPTPPNPSPDPEPTPRQTGLPGMPVSAPSMFDWTNGQQPYNPEGKTYLQYGEIDQATWDKLNKVVDAVKDIYKPKIPLCTSPWRTSLYLPGQDMSGYIESHLVACVDNYSVRLGNHRFGQPVTVRCWEDVGEIAMETVDNMRRGTIRQATDHTVENNHYRLLSTAFDGADRSWDIRFGIEKGGCPLLSDDEEYVRISSSPEQAPYRRYFGPLQTPPNMGDIIR